MYFAVIKTPKKMTTMMDLLVYLGVAEGIPTWTEENKNRVENAKCFSRKLIGEPRIEAGLWKISFKCVTFVYALELLFNGVKLSCIPFVAFV